MKRPDSLIIVGSSGCGKSTLVDGLRIPEFSDHVVIPHRFVTRPERQRDNFAENSHVSRALFFSGVHCGFINPWWERKMDNRRIEHYGFVAVSGEESRLTVYSANNAFLTSQIGNSHITAENGLVVIVKADREVREARLLERSPDLSEAERAVRLGDEGFTARDFTNSFVIDTTHLNAEAGQHIFSDLVRELVDR